MTTTEIIVAVPMLSMLAVATLTDLRHRTISNGLSLGGAAVGLMTQAMLHGGASGLVLGLFGWLVCLVCFLPFYVSGGMAGGDVKLMAAVGAFLGPVDGLTACLCTLAAGALVGSISVSWDGVRRVVVGIVAAKRLAAGRHDAAGESLAARVDAGAKIPYAGAIAAGATLAVLHPPLLDALLQGEGLWQ